MQVHGDNFRRKESHKTKYQSDEHRRYLAEIREMYDIWHNENVELIGPSAIPSEDDRELVYARVESLERYKAFLDQEQYAVGIDSRSNLHSSVIGAVSLLFISGSSQ